MEVCTRGGYHPPTNSDFANYLAYVACAIAGKGLEVELKVLAGLNTVYKVDREQFGPEVAF